MNAKILFSLVAVVLLAGLGYVYIKNDDTTSQSTQETTSATETAVTDRNCVSDECLKIDDLEYPVGELPESVVSALKSAIDDEYKARATYEAVIGKLGSTRPFSMIIRAEEQHISSLKALFDKYGLDIPEDPYTNVEVASIRSENCSVGVEAEILNASLYRDNLLPAVKDYPDIISVFTNLMNASQNNHLPAFERCAS